MATPMRPARVVSQVAASAIPPAYAVSGPQLRTPSGPSDILSAENQFPGPRGCISCPRRQSSRPSVPASTGKAGRPLFARWRDYPPPAPARKPPRGRKGHTGKPQSHTALVCFNDISAIGAIRALCDHGLRVPEDVSVVGFDDIQGAAYLNPRLTTIRQPLGEMGATAARILLKRIREARTIPSAWRSTRS